MNWRKIAKGHLSKSEIQKLWIPVAFTLQEIEGWLELIWEDRTRIVAILAVQRWQNTLSMSKIGHSLGSKYACRILKCKWKKCKRDVRAKKHSYFEQCKRFLLYWSFQMDQSQGHTEIRSSIFFLLKHRERKSTWDLSQDLRRCRQVS